jgi:hypothetical protein
VSTISTPRTDVAREVARRARLAEIRDGAITRQQLGQSAHHRLLADGRHEVTIDGQTATGVTLAEAIDAARAQAQGDGGPRT